MVRLSIRKILGYLLWIALGILTYKMFAKLIGLSRFLSLTMTIVLLGAAQYRQYRKMLIANRVNLLFMDLIMAESWERVVNILKSNRKLAQYIPVVKETLVPEMHRENHKILKCIIETVARVGDERILLISSGKDDIINKIGFIPKLPLHRFYSLQSEGDDEIIKLLHQTEMATNSHDIDSLNILIPKLQDVFNYEVSKNMARSFQISGVLALALLKRRNENDFEACEKIIIYIEDILKSGKIETYPSDKVILKILQAKVTAHQADTHHIEMYEETLSFFEEAIKISNDTKDLKLLCYVYLEMVKVFLFEFPAISIEILNNTVKYADLALKTVLKAEKQKTDLNPDWKSMAYAVRGIAYLNRVTHFPNNDEISTLQECVRTFEKAVKYADKNTQNYWMAYGHLGATNVWNSTFNEVDPAIGMKQVKSAIKKLIDPNIKTCLLSEISWALFTGGHLSEAKKLLEDQFTDFKKQETIKKTISDAQHIGVIGENLAYIYCIEGNFEQAIECLEYSRSYYFKENIDYDKAALKTKLKTVLNKGVTPIYFIVTNRGAFLLVIGEVKESYNSTIKITSLQIDNFKLNEFARKLSNEFSNLDKRYEHLTTLIQPLVNHLFNEKLHRVALLTNGLIGQFAFECVPCRHNSKTILFMDEFCISYISAITILSKDYSNKNNAIDRALIIGSSAEELKMANLEVLQISSYFKNVDLYPDGKISSAEFRNKLKEADLFHFAGHGYLDPLNPYNSFLVLSKNNRVSGYDLYDNDFNASQHQKLAILSACNSANPDLTFLAYQGLSLALCFMLSINFRSVIGTLTKVNDKIAYLFIMILYEQLIKMSSYKQTAIALQKAKKIFRNMNKEELIEKILSWPNAKECLGTEFINKLMKQETSYNPITQNLSSYGTYILVGIPEL